MIPRVQKLFNECVHNGEDLLSAFYSLFHLQFCDSIVHCVAKVISSLRDILRKNNRYYNSYRFGYKFAFILYLSFLTNQR